MKNTSFFKTDFALQQILNKFFEVHLLFSPNFIFSPTLEEESDDFLTFIQKHKENPLIILQYHWIEFIIYKYGKTKKLETYLKSFLIEFAFINKILVNPVEISTLTSNLSNDIKNGIFEFEENDKFISHITSLINNRNILDSKKTKNLKTVDHYEAFKVINSSFTRKFHPKNTITIEYPSLYPNNAGKYIDFLRYYNNRYQQLSTIIKESLNPDLKQIIFEDFDSYELHKQYVFIIFIEQINLIHEKKSKMKTLNQEIQFHGVNPAFQYQFIISINPDELNALDPLNLPTGIVCGFSGEIEKEQNLDFSSILHIKASKILLPPLRDNLRKNDNLNEIDDAKSQIGMDNYALVIGSLNIDKISNSNYDRLIEWLSNPPVNYRLKYVFFIGGILSHSSFRFNESSKFDNKEVSEIYKLFLTDISELPENVDYFFQPGFNDYTRRYIPQPPIAPKYTIKQNNMHYISNPAKLRIEDQNLLFYNPTNHFWQNSCPYQENGYKVLFDMLQFRHLNPNWEQPVKTVPDSRDFLVIDSVPRVFIASHPHSTQIPLFRTILAGIITPFNRLDNISSSSQNGIGILFNVRDPSKREIITLLK